MDILTPRIPPIWNQEPRIHRHFEVADFFFFIILCVFFPWGNEGLRWLCLWWHCTVAVTLESEVQLRPQAHENSNIDWEEAIPGTFMTLRGEIWICVEMRAEIITASEIPTNYVSLWARVEAKVLWWGHYRQRLKKLTWFTDKGSKGGVGYSNEEQFEQRQRRPYVLELW